MTKEMGEYHGHAYNRPIGRGVCIEGDRNLEDMLDEGFYLLTITWRKLEGEEAKAAEKVVFP